MLRLFVAALACASFLLAVEPEDHVRKSAPVSSATRLVLNVDIGTIRVQPGDGKTVQAEVYFHGFPPSQAEFDRMRRDFTLDIVQEGSDIHVIGAFHKGWQPMLAVWPTFFGSHSMCRNWQCLEYTTWLREVEYRVTVPEKFNADVETSGGPIFVSRLNGEVNARTSGGSLDFDGIDGAVNARTSGGSITLTGGKGRAIVHTSGGGIQIRDAVGPIDASTSGGGVRVSLLGQPKEECRLYTSGGSIDVRLDKDAHVDLDASASGGGVWTDFAVPSSGERHRNELHVPLNGGGPRLYLHTSGGGISVRHED
ncbi:MAG: DUF4097 family beta strand repeat-containing protein [Bryobacteraceae bacterium]